MWPRYSRAIRNMQRLVKKFCSQRHPSAHSYAYRSFILFRVAKITTWSSCLSIHLIILLDVRHSYPSEICSC
uniref:Uncharacterized protein n=1 Tax=Parascaris univalens TaxID=6257 RepID=A0A915CAX8_PARUN